MNNTNHIGEQKKIVHLKKKQSNKKELDLHCILEGEPFFFIITIAQDVE